jgi:hypothetical protein
LSGYVYVDVSGRDIGSYVTAAKDAVRQKVSVPAGEIAAAADDGVGSLPQCVGGAVDHMPRASAQHLVPADTVVRAKAQPGGEVRLAEALKLSVFCPGTSAKRAQTGHNAGRVAAFVFVILFRTP